MKEQKFNAILCKHPWNYYDVYYYKSYKGIEKAVNNIDNNKTDYIDHYCFYGISKNELKSTLIHMYEVRMLVKLYVQIRDKIINSNDENKDEKEVLLEHEYINALRRFDM